MTDAPAFLDLINTEHIHSAERVTDHLEDPTAGARLAERWGLGREISSRDLAGLRALRTMLRDAVAELMRTATLGSETLAALNAHLGAGRPSLRRDDAGSFRLEERWPSAAAFVTAGFARALTEDDPRRLKLCANPHCRWAFRDESKNRSRRWCSSAACGNVARLRTFRARKDGAN